jgi:hypothetical protein
MSRIEKTRVTTMVKDRRQCPHDTLSFGSGAYYVICQDCLQYWVATGNQGDKPDPSAGGDKVSGKRVKPKS